MFLVEKMPAFEVNVQSGSLPVPGLLPMPRPGLRLLAPKLTREKIVCPCR